MRNPRGVGGVGSVGGWGRSLTPHTPLPVKPKLCVRNPGIIFRLVRVATTLSSQTCLLLAFPIFSKWREGWVGVYFM
ncbi:MAG: hypothetical protein V7K61_16215 [Nostoc sp.]